MAIVRSTTGKFYDVDDNVLEGKEVKPEDLPKEMQKSGPDPGMMGSGMMGGGAGMGNLAGLIQIIVNVPQGAPPPPGAVKPGEGAEGDVAGHHGGGEPCWANYWRNCWRNYCWQNYCWYNC